MSEMLLATTPNIATPIAGPLDGGNWLVLAKTLRSIHATVSCGDSHLY